MAMSVEQLAAYLAMALVILLVYAATIIILVRKYKERGNKAHAWAAAAFTILALQEIIVCVWLYGQITGTYSIYLRPLYLQSLAVLSALLLLGLSITGKIKD